MLQRLLTFGIPVGVVVGTQVALGYGLQKQPQPGPEHQRLQFFVGRWQFQGEEKPSPFGSGAKFKGTTTCEWFDGRFHVICRTEGTSPEGSSKELEVLTYDANRAVYTRYNFGSFGQSALATGKMDDKTWRWSGESTTKGKVMRFDFLVTETSADSYTFKVDVSIDNGPPSTISEGKATRMT